MKHTKGQWKQRVLFDKPLLIIPEDGSKEWYSNEIMIQGDDERIICTVDYKTDSPDQGWGKNNTIKKWKANAKLIAAAPELLEAAQELIDMTEFPEEFHNALNKLEDAIKKATK